MRLNNPPWKAITLALKFRNPETTNAVLCGHFACYRKSTSGPSIPSRLYTYGVRLTRRSVGASQYNSHVDEVLFHCNPIWARVRLPNGQEETTSTHQLAPPAIHQVAVEPMHQTPLPIPRSCFINDMSDVNRHPPKESDLSSSLAETHIKFLTQCEQQRLTSL